VVIVQKTGDLENVLVVYTAWPWEPGRSGSGRKIFGSSAARSWAPRRMPFYDRLNEILDQHHFDRNVEHLCRRYYKGPLGRPSITPGVYFRTLLLGYFEGIDSERGIAWRLADSLSMRRFIAYALTEATPITPASPGHGGYSQWKRTRPYSGGC